MIVPTSILSVCLTTLLFGGIGEASPAKPVLISPRYPDDPVTLSPGGSKSVLIVGGGLAGMSAALELGERGYAVTIKEADSVMGGRLYTKSQAIQNPTGPLGPNSTFHVEHGFHAWFSNYHQFKDIRARLGVNGNFRPWGKVDYIFKKYKPESVYSEGPYPLNLLGILTRSPNMHLTDAIKLTLAAPDLIWFNYQTVYEQYDHLTFYEWADKKKIDRTFFEIMMEPALSVTLNDPNVISAATMLTLMQLYFLSDADADKREVLKVPFGQGLIDPWTRHLLDNNVKIYVDSPVAGLAFQGTKCVGELIGGTQVIPYDHVILAADLPGIRRIMAGSWVDDATASAVDILKGRFEDLGLAPPYKVLRVWFDGPLNADRPDILETPQHRPINLVARYDRLEGEFMDWAAAVNGSVVEFHLYTWKADWAWAKDSASVWGLVKPTVYSIYPELAGFNAVGFTLQAHENFPSYAKGLEARRPTADFPSSLGMSGLVLAGDYVKTAYPSALMERAVSTGREAANLVLVHDRVRAAPMIVAPSRGPGIF